MSQSTLISPIQALFPARLFGRTRLLTDARGTAVPGVRTQHADVVGRPSPSSRASADAELIRAQAHIFLALR
jgi:hypothetical protein